MPGIDKAVGIGVDPPGERRLQPGDGAQERGFADSVWAAQHDRATGLKLEGHPFEHLDPAARYRQI